MTANLIQGIFPFLSVLYYFLPKAKIMSEEDDFDLNDLDDKELVEQIQDDLYDGLDLSLIHI